MKKQILFAAGLLLSGTSAFAAEAAAQAGQQEDSQITINGMTKPLLGHINQAILWNPEHLRLVDLVRYTPGKGYVLFAQGKPNLTDEALSDIESGNWVFLEFYKMDKRGTGQYENVGAIVFGTRDQEVAHGLHFAAMRQLVSK